MNTFVDHQGHPDQWASQDEMEKTEQKVIQETLDEWANADQLENQVQLAYQAATVLT